MRHQSRSPRRRDHPGQGCNAGCNHLHPTADHPRAIQLQVETGNIRSSLISNLVRPTISCLSCNFRPLAQPIGACDTTRPSSHSPGHGSELSYRRRGSPFRLGRWSTVSSLRVTQRFLPAGTTAAGSSTLSVNGVPATPCGARPPDSFSAQPEILLAADFEKGRDCFLDGHNPGIADALQSVVCSRSRNSVVLCLFSCRWSPMSFPLLSPDDG
jgi:hypothetical protein